MRKSFILLIVLILSAGTVFAGSGDSMTIGGVVPLTLELLLAQAVGADDLDLDSTTTAAADIVIATTDIETNSSAGWTLVVMSENASSLVNEEGEAIAYTISYAQTAGAVSTPVTGATLTAAGVPLADSNLRTAAGTNETGELQISYPRALTYAAGYYSDLLTITLRAK